MANTLTDLIVDAQAALDVVSREVVGLIPSVLRHPTTDRAAIGQSVRVPKIPVVTGRNIVPGMSLPSEASHVFTDAEVKITKQRAFPFSWSSEESYAVDQGVGVLSYRQAQIAQAFRAAVKEISKDIYDVAVVNGTRAYGSASTPFQSSVGDSAQMKKILDDVGAPDYDRALVIDTSAGAALRSLGNLTRANEAATDATLRRGVLLDLNGFAIREDAAIYKKTTGGSGSYLINNASGYAIGDTVLTVDGGTNTIIAGDVIGIGNHKYIVKGANITGGAGTVTLEAPGLVESVSDNAAITVVASTVRNLAFSRDAIVLAARLPRADEDDQANFRAIVSDEVSGLNFEIARYPGYRMSTYEVAICWGVAAVNPRHIAHLLG